MKTFAAAGILFMLLLSGVHQLKAQSAEGAWQVRTDSTTTIMLVTPDYFTITTYTPATFISTMGGTWQGTTEGNATTTIEFNSADKSQVGQHPDAAAAFEGDHLALTLGGKKLVFTRVDDGIAALAGRWQITAREANGKMNHMPSGARKTIKILTGTKFQWVAINTETGEFFGTGGGSYTFENNGYTEKIEYFSRDNNRVGASLSFKGSVNGDKWDHSGKSSDGKPLHEEWSRK